MNKLISQETLFEGRRFNVYRKKYENQKGEEYIRDVVDPGDASVVLALTENDEIIFIKQYREAIEQICLELPAGMIDPGENPEEAALRELREETGYVAQEIHSLISVYNSYGYTTEKTNIFVAKNLKLETQSLDEDENILEIVKIPVKECIKMAKERKLISVTQNLAIFMYAYINGINE